MTQLPLDAWILLLLSVGLGLGLETMFYLSRRRDSDRGSAVAEDASGKGGAS